MLAVRYPGRQDRLAEACIEDMATLADTIENALRPWLDRPLALFGHSMGACVAYELALRLEVRGIVPEHLLVSAHAAPQRAEHTALHSADDESLITRVRHLGDLHSDAYDIPELRDLLLPALRADYRLIEGYHPRIRLRSRHRSPRTSARTIRVACSTESSPGPTSPPRAPSSCARSPGTTSTSWLGRPKWSRTWQRASHAGAARARSDGGTHKGQVPCVVSPRPGLHLGPGCCPYGGDGRRARHRAWRPRGFQGTMLVPGAEARGVPGRDHECCDGEGIMRPGTRVADAILRLLSRDWAGLAIALLLAAAGACCVTLGTGWRILGGVLCAVALVLALGSLRHLMHVARVRVRYPPPGRMVDVGGYRMHILAEGDAGPRPTVVWMPGGHRRRVRHVPTTRAGAGTGAFGPGGPSGFRLERPGPVPAYDGSRSRRTAHGAGAGLRKGALCFRGALLRGLLMANAARRRPDLVAGLVLLDPTPPDVVAFGPSLPALRHAVRDQTALALRHLFGLHALVPKNEARSLEDPTQVLAVIETRTKANCAAASILRELSPDGITRDGWQTVVHDGELGSLPLFLVAPRDLTGGDKIFDAVDDPEESARVRHFFLTVRERFLAASSAARRVYTPEGTGHDFPDRVPEFVVQVVESLLDERGPGAPDPF